MSDFIQEQLKSTSLIYDEKLEEKLSKKYLVFEKKIDSSLKDITATQKWFKEYSKDFYKDEKYIAKLTFAFGELILNAYEHGSLGLSTEDKHNLLMQDALIEKLQELELQTERKIFLSIYIIDAKYMVIKIKDEGCGFEHKILDTVYKNPLALNGRGVFMSKKNVLGIYYNQKGNISILVDELR